MPAIRGKSRSGLFPLGGDFENAKRFPNRLSPHPAAKASRRGCTTGNRAWANRAQRTENQKSLGD